MRTKIIIARHGNTFHPGETSTRVGAKTDIPLVEEHRGKSIGFYLKDNDLMPNAVFAAPLLRTMKTAELAIEAMELQMKVLPLKDFTEVDYGPDENKTEEEVMSRLGNGNPEEGKKIIDAWNRDATVPDGWNIDPNQIIKTWHNFAKQIVAEKYQTVLLITSNGILRFAPHITGNFENFILKHDIKVATGGVCFFEKKHNEPVWTCTAWNVKPFKMYSE